MNTLELGQHCFALLRDGLGGDADALGMFCDLFTADGELWLPPPRARAPVDPVPELTVRQRIPPHGPSQFKIAADQFQAANQGSRVRCRAGRLAG